MVIDSRSSGDPARFGSLEFLEAALAAPPRIPRDAGRVVLLVRRSERGRREIVDRTPMTPESGLPGDAWGRSRHRVSETQLTVMQADVAELIANGQPLALFGDNLFLELDLSAENLPAGSRLRAGSVTLEVTFEPHNGCHKFRERFGGDALRLLSKQDLRPLNLRGVYMRVVQAGEISAGDAVEVTWRPGPGATGDVGLE